jgi:peptide-methionine (R)-S-oxide reductase
MKAAARITALALTAGITLFQLSCGDASADGGKKAMDTDKKAPAQPTKPVKKTDAEWRKTLSPEQYAILRHHDTERPYGKVYDEFKKQAEGTYYCVGCNAELFTSKEKFDARCGWPAFYDASQHKNIKTIRDTSAGMLRIEVRCRVCEGHLGHIFEGEGFNTPTDQRYCINGKVLKFVPKAPADDQTKGEKDPAKDNKPSKKSE